ncbi:hypothetical protein GURKE_04000 [Brevundimonas phage vB_BpoS-Gurke]|uniref:Uncharacterized protein n=1 Tax=Brevundimonas phage vB_BpoS-Gurke TaxID=2948599 RepID=A0A9E7STJ6_9CAUD|nr:hypothetical protein GURKE_04000 [Brevundimonas phage vB_BpoS-Gurke]
MATERVYSPDLCEPFDVTPSKAQKLVLEQGWSRTPWTRVEVTPTVETVDPTDEEPTEIEALEPEPARGRGRRRRASEDTVSDDDDALWRS